MKARNLSGIALIVFKQNAIAITMPRKRWKIIFTPGVRGWLAEFPDVSWVCVRCSAIQIEHCTPGFDAKLVQSLLHFDKNRKFWIFRLEKYCDSGRLGMVGGVSRGVLGLFEVSRYSD